MSEPVRQARDGNDRSATISPPVRGSTVSAVAAVTAVYVYFLIFAQFGFLKLLQAAPDGSTLLRPVMITMGLAGIVASVLVAGIYSEARGRALLIGSLTLAGAGAAAALVAATPALIFGVAIATGAGAGGATVALAPLLKQQTGTRLGRCIGWGTGLAYGICNLPGTFDAGPRQQAVIAMIAVAFGVLAASRFESGKTTPESDGVDYGAAGIGRWTIIFLALVWLDSAAFYIIQHTPVFRQATWTGNGQLVVNAVTHCSAAVAAGWALDRNWIGRIVLTAGLLLGSAALLLGAGGEGSAVIALSYTVGVSFYSAALVFYPARSERVRVAAVVYAVSGWLGTALGIGMAGGLNTVPAKFVVTMATLLLGMLAIRWVTLRQVKINSR